MTNRKTRTLDIGWCSLLAAGILLFSRGFLSFVAGGWSNFIVLPLFILPFISFIARPRFSNFYYTSLNFVMTAFLTYILFLIPFADSVPRGIIGATLLIYYATIYFFISGFKFNSEYFEENFDFFMNVLFYFLSFFCLIEILTNVPLSTFPQHLTPESMHFIYPYFRMSSSIGSTLPFGVTYCYFALYLVSKFLATRKTNEALKAIFAIFITLGTFNRGAMGMLLVGIFAITIKYLWLLTVGQERTNSRRLYYISSIMLVITVALFTASLVVPGAVVDRMFASFNWQTESSNMRRLDHWINAISYFQKSDNWLTGLSLGASGNVLDYFGMHSLLGEFGVTESYYLKLLVETGLIGLFLFLLLTSIAVLKSNGFKIRKLNSAEGAIKIFLPCAIFSQCVQLAFLQSLESTSVAFMFFVTLGVINAIDRSDRHHSLL